MVDRFQVKIRTIAIAFTLTVFGLGILSPEAALATYQHDNLISDISFTNKSTMNASSIQSFLNSRNSGLRNYKQDGRSAARIIHEAAQDYGINPQVIIATLQKEQSLITDPNPSAIQLRSAMGYNCPTTGTCSPSFAGFRNQVINGTWQLRFNYERASGNNTWWNNASYACGSSRDYYKPGLFPGNTVRFYDHIHGKHYATVKIANAATASMYCYTPHVYNPSGNPTYYSGSYNFVTSYTQWFGDPRGSVQVEAVLLDGATDATGERGQIGYRLSHKPRSNVRININTSSPSNVRIVGSSSVTITPSTWNKPEQNTVSIEGRNNPHANGAVFAFLGTSRPISNDQRYSSLSASQTPNAPVINLDKSSTQIFRLYSKDLNQHRFTPSITERNSLMAQGWANEGARFSTCRGARNTIVRLSRSGSDETRLVDVTSRKYRDYIQEGFSIDQAVGATDANGSIPVYERYDPERGRTLYTTNVNEGLNAGFEEDKGIAFYGCEPDHIPVYRLYNSASGNHFITRNPNERNKAISTHKFRYENVAFNICGSGTTNVYRLYRRSTNSHLYTLSAGERDKAARVHGFIKEGTGFKLCEDSTRDVYRLYRKSTNSHLFTISSGERSSAVRLHGFKDEGVAFKAL